MVADCGPVVDHLRVRTVRDRAFVGAGGVSAVGVEERVAAVSLCDQAGDFWRDGAVDDDHRVDDVDPSGAAPCDDQFHHRFGRAGVVAVVGH